MCVASTQCNYRSSYDAAAVADRRPQRENTLFHSTLSVCRGLSSVGSVFYQIRGLRTANTSLFSHQAITKP